MSAADASTLSVSERLGRLRLIRAENVGPITYRQLLARYGSAEAALAALPDLARLGGRQRPISIPSKAAAERELADTEATGGFLLFEGEPDFPPLLSAAEGSPPVLVGKGHRQLLRRRCFAVVGARNASAAGVRLAREIAAGLGQADLAIVSGLARGIDAAAHQGALESGTVAVLAGGVDIVYPPENETLHRRIEEIGLLLSEMPVGLRPQGRHFPRRNRIISGLSEGVLVVEAALHSGSLITARFALEQNREVFAAPGSPLDPRCRGSNDLIRQGATLTESADDIVQVLSGMARPFAEPEAIYRAPIAAPASSADLDVAREPLKRKLGPTPIEVDELIRQCDLTPPIVLTILLELELAGILARHPGNRVSLK